MFEAAHLNHVPLLCPRDRGPLSWQGDKVRCEACGTLYPVVGEVPVLINDDTSVFSTADYVVGSGYTGASYGRSADQSSGLRRFGRRLVGRLSATPTSLRHPGAAQAIQWVGQRRPGARVLIIGSGGLLLNAPEVQILNTDVAFGPGVAMICDAHDLPFPNGSFDLVVANAVLEHVADPARCVAEMRRVLVRGGWIFAETPFLQPVHMGAYDFTRFTPIGHRRLFREFDEVAAGIALGAGSTLAYALRAFLLGLSPWRPWRMVAGLSGLLLGAPLRLLDRAARHDRGAAAAGCWFFGQRREGPPVSDRTLVRDYYRTLGYGPAVLPE
ncbi:methyltransferase domain-containing protein [Belnapia moabensis]|uniref:methyltransferase domain-containing protein n=1 Tax=Belnapia moabensis TaxID=365533 RepID=UPI0006945052|nr:methyltransferase domain-containing protein [Belnapia moabensis]